MHEHWTLSKGLELAQNYDQLNVVNLACAEVVIKWRMLIEQAYSEHFMGLRDTERGEYIDKEAIKYQAQQLRDEGQILQERRLKAEEDAAVQPAAGPRR